ncbi:MAG: hypothetical protein Q8R83_03310 [Legionellaceae bacterium]|nr:hypothetical protein [Legionellaceae bacterium]
MPIKNSNKIIAEKLKTAELQKQKANLTQTNMLHANSKKISSSTRIDTAVEAEALRRESMNGPTDTMIELEELKDNLGPLDTPRELKARNEGPGVINTADRAKAVGKKVEDTNEIPTPKMTR